MSTFLTPLDVRYIDGESWEVRSPFEYRIGEAYSGQMVEIPAGFITDFASIPRVFWPLLPPTGGYGKAAVIHDWLYRRRIVHGYQPSQFGETWTNLHHEWLVGRGEADSILKEAMEVLGVGWFTRQTIYLGVRSGGWWAWRQCRKREL